MCWVQGAFRGLIEVRYHMCYCMCEVCCVDLILPLQDLTKQLDEVTQNSEIVEIRQKEAECELEAARDRVQQQATEILLKASKTLGFLPFPPLIWACSSTISEHLHPRYPQDTSLDCHANTSTCRSSHLVWKIIASNTLMA